MKQTYTGVHANMNCLFIAMQSSIIGLLHLLLTWVGMMYLCIVSLINVLLCYTNLTMFSV